MCVVGVVSEFEVGRRLVVGIEIRYEDRFRSPRDTDSGAAVCIHSP